MAVLCILLGLLTFLTFINQSFIELNNFNLELLLFLDLTLLLVLFGLIIKETFKILRNNVLKYLVKYLVIVTSFTLQKRNPLT
mgnify:CR=1 FL=1